MISAVKRIQPLAPALRTQAIHHDITDDNVVARPDAGGRLLPFWSRHPAVLGYRRPAPQGDDARGGVLVLANFSERPASVLPEVLSAQPATMVDLIGQTAFDLRAGLTLAPYQMVWLVASGA